MLKLAGGRTETLLDGLIEPHGLALQGGCLYVVDAGAKSVLSHDLDTGAQLTLATNLPVGPPPGVTPKLLKGLPPIAGPMRPFSGIAAAADGTLYISANGEGGIVALRPAWAGTGLA